MKGFSKFIAVGAVLAASSSFAFADSINGSFSVTGFNNTTINSTSTGGTITITSAALGDGNTAYNGTTYGIFGTFASYLTDGNPITLLSPLSFATGTNTIASGTPALFSVTENGETFSLYGTSYEAQILGTGPNATVAIYDGVGIFTGTGVEDFTASPSSFSFTTQNGTLTTFSAQADATGATAVTPEPNSLVLLGTGLIGAAGMLFMRRRNAMNGI